MNKKQWIKYTNKLVNDKQNNGPLSEQTIRKYLIDRTTELNEKFHRADKANGSAGMINLIESLMETLASHEYIIVCMAKFLDRSNWTDTDKVKAVKGSTNNYIHNIISKNNRTLGKFIK